MLNPHWLKTFEAVSDLGSFTRAAQQLGLTQAAASQHVRQLEARLGPLLIRRPRKLELTPAGEALIEYCHAMEQAGRRLTSRLADAELDAWQGDVGLVTPGSVGLVIYPLLLELQRTHPGLTVRHRFAPDAEALDAVLHKRFEAGLVTLRPDDPRLTASAFIDEPLELVAPAGAEVHTWQDLERLGFIDHPDGLAMATRLLSRRFPDNPGVRTLPIHGFTNQVALMMEPVAQGLGFTVIPRHARQAFTRPDALQVIECGAPVIDTLWLIHRSEWPLSNRARLVIGHIQRALLAYRFDGRMTAAGT